MSATGEIVATTGQSLGRYRIIEQIGAGGMGVVYRARDERLERDVALKLLPAGTLADKVARKRFRQEALALSQLNHPNIATIYDFDSQSGVDFLAMEYIHGTTLDCKLTAGALAEKEVLSFGGQLASGLVAAHERGVVHRDLKPGNLRLTPDGQLKILDFGLAKLLPPEAASAGTETLSQTQHTVAGTLPYMAPEQLLGERVDARTDIYAMGAVLHAMATGRPPFPEEQTSRLADAILRQTPVPVRNLNPRISPQLETIILKCLEKDAENRYQSAKEAGVDLRRAAGAHSGEMLRAAPKRALWYRTLAVLGAVAVTGLLFSLNVGGMRNRLLGGAASPSRITSLAVLPLDNFSHDPEQEFFADGMTEELITELAQVHALRIISRTSAMIYKGTHKPLPEIARELHVDAIVEGSVLRSGDKVRITAQLVEAATDRHLWAKSFDRDLRDVLTLQSDVARNIAHEIQVNVTPQEEARLARSRPVKPAAHEDYLKGLYYWNQFTDQGMKKATEYFQQAIAEDPDYALAYVGLADAYHESANATPNELMPKAKAAVLKALELDSTLGEAHATLGWIKWVYDWDWPGAELEFRRSIELEPDSGAGMYADYLDAMGRFEEGMRQHKRARESDPISLIGSSNVAYGFYLARQYDRAIEHFKKTLEIDPGFALAHMSLADLYWRKGMYKEYVAELQEGLRLGGYGQQAEGVGRAFRSSGPKGAAIFRLQSLKQQRSQGYVPASSIAAAYLRLGEKDNAVTWLEKAYEERDPELAWARVEPVWDGLRSEPRFVDLMRRMGFSSTLH